MNQLFLFIQVCFFSWASPFQFRGEWELNESHLLLEMIREIESKESLQHFFTQLNAVGPIYLDRGSKNRFAAATTNLDSITFFDLFFDLTENEIRRGGSEHLRILLHEMVHCLDFRRGFPHGKPLSYDPLFQKSLNFSSPTRHRSFAKTEPLVEEYLSLRISGKYQTSQTYNFLQGAIFQLPTIYSSIDVKEAAAELVSTMVFPPKSQAQVPKEALDWVTKTFLENPPERPADCEIKTPL